MRLVIAAVGKLKGAESELVARYAQRVSGAGRSVALGPLAVQEIPESKTGSRELRMADEAARLLALAKSASVLILLDETGKAMSSTAFAGFLRDLRDRGESEAAFLLGGPDGHGDKARAAARTTLSLGPMTLPHGLARAVLAEQLYRATTILSGHPYHRV
jgi:23S rRNA (pseudouridine1915-N3)-methyltransferase